MRWIEIGIGTCALGGLLLVGASELRAQEAGGARAAERVEGLERHRGVWLSGGLGVAVDDDEAAAAGYFRLGGTLTPRVLLGGELIGFTREEGGVDISRGNALFTVVVYPERSGLLLLKAGIGFSTIEVAQEIAGGGTLSVSDEGFGAGLGAGLDIRLGNNLSLTPGLDLMLQTPDDFGDLEAFPLLTVGLTMH